MDLQLNGKTALVSGSTAGIGFAIAQRLAAEGASVIINGRTQPRVDEAKRKILKALPHAAISGFALDLGTAEGVAELVRQLPHVDILVNNLGIFKPVPFTDITDAEWQQFFDVNVMSGVRLSRHYLKGMLAGNWGRIIFISSESGIQIPAEMVHYGFTKTAQIAIARGIAETTAGTAVTVNSVLPGPTRSEGVGVFIENLAQAQQKTPAQVEKEFFEQVRPSSLIKRLIEPDEIADVVAFVASPRAAAINGASLRAEGGVIRSI